MTLYLSNRDGDGKTSEEGHYRLQTQILAGDTLGSTSMLVVQNSPLGMSVLVSAGDFKIYTGADYSYTGWNNASQSVAITTADPANPRITTIVAFVDKAEATAPSPPNNPGVIKLMAVNGTPVAVPVAPNGATIQSAVGSGNPYIILADVLVNAAATQITNANITDRRTLLRIANDIVKTDSLENLSVSTAKLADSGVTTAKIADLNVTTGKLANNAVTAAKIEAQESWIVPTLSNGWVVYDTNYNIPGYYKDSLGFVHIKGMIKSGTSGLVFTLPVGYRPLRRYLYATETNPNVNARLDVYPNGQVIATGYSATWFSMDVPGFRAEQ